MKCLKLILATLLAGLFIIQAGCNNGQVSSKDAENFYANGSKEKSDNSDQHQEVTGK